MHISGRRGKSAFELGHQNATNGKFLATGKLKILPQIPDRVVAGDYSGRERDRMDTEKCWMESGIQRAQSLQSVGTREDGLPPVLVIQIPLHSFGQTRSIVLNG